MDINHPRILLVQFRTDASADHEYQCLVRYSELTPGHWHRLNAFGDPRVFLDPKKILASVDCVVFGGSGQFMMSMNDASQGNAHFNEVIVAAGPFVDYVLTHDIPTLGMSFGHQILAKNLGAAVDVDPRQQEVGTCTIHITEQGRQSLLFHGMPLSFKAQAAHRDSIVRQPQGTTLLARSDRCHVAAFRYKQNIYAVQFQPELDMDDLSFRLRLYPAYTGGRSVEDITRTLEHTPEASMMLRNFFLRCVPQAYQ